MGMANFMYSDDSDGDIPPAWGIPKGANATYWHENQAFQDYLQEKNPNDWFWVKQYHCPLSPAFSQADPQRNITKTYSSNSNKATVSGAWSWSTEACEVRNLGRINNSSAVMFIDGTSLSQNQPSSSFENWLASGEVGNKVAYRHNGKANFVSFDGSAKSGGVSRLDNKYEAWQTGY